MDINPDYMPDTDMTELLLVASNIMGWPIAEVEALIRSELDTSHLLVYLTAMMSDRMN
jgi:hypothetical protein